MGCGCQGQTGERTREVIADLFAAGKYAAAEAHRRAICNTSSECGQWCPRLVKGPGVGQVFCVSDDGKVHLPSILASPDDACPVGNW